MRFSRHLLACALASIGTFAQSQNPGPAEPFLPQIAAACTQAKRTPLPADIAAAPTPRLYPRCDSYTLYDKKTFPAARACALRERAALLARLPGSPNDPNPKPIPGTVPDQFPETPAGGLIVLSELYANAEGVPANPALAARFLCEALDTHEIEAPINDVDAKSILATLDLLHNRTSTTPPFLFCDGGGQTPEGRPTTRECEELAEEAHAEMHAGGIQGADDDAKNERTEADKHLRAALKKLKPTELPAYTALHRAYLHFVRANVTASDLYLPPYAPGGLGPAYDYQKNNLATIYDRAVAQLIQSRAPAQAAADFQPSDAALNTAWQTLLRTMAQREAPDAREAPSAITELRAEQRAWLAYRNALATFGKTLNPAIAPEAWMTALTQDRVADLTAVNEQEGFELQQQQTTHAALKTQYEESVLELDLNPYRNAWTIEQKQAWETVKEAMKNLVTVHDKSIASPGITFGAAVWNVRMAALLALEKDGPPPAGDFAISDRELNDAYRAAMQSTCLFLPVPGALNPDRHPTPDSLRDEQRAWLPLRDAWTALAHLLFPSTPQQQFAIAITADRAMYLRHRASSCHGTTPPPFEP